MEILVRRSRSGGVSRMPSNALPTSANTKLLSEFCTMMPNNAPARINLYRRTWERIHRAGDDRFDRCWPATLNSVFTGRDLRGISIPTGARRQRETDCLL